MSKKNAKNAKNAKNNYIDLVKEFQKLNVQTITLSARDWEKLLEILEKQDPAENLCLAAKKYLDKINSVQKK